MFHLEAFLPDHPEIRVASSVFNPTSLKPLTSLQYKHDGLEARLKRAQADRILDQHADDMVALADVLDDMGRHELALEWIAQAAKAKGHTTRRMKAIAASCRYELGEEAAAHALWAELADAGDPVMAFNAAISAPDLDVKEKFVRQVLALQPAHGAAWCLLAEVEIARGETGQKSLRTAQRYLEAQLLVAPSSRFLLHYLAKVYDTLGDEDRAEQVRQRLRVLSLQEFTGTDTSAAPKLVVEPTVREGGHAARSRHGGSVLKGQHRWLPAFHDLDEEQKRVILDSLEGRVLVYGPAGAGKAALCLYRAKTVLDQRPAAKLVILASTNVLVKFRQDGADVLELPRGTVQSFYGWLRRLYRQHLGTPPDYGEAKHRIWIDEMIEYLRAHPRRIPRYDHVVVDEAQDLSSNAATLLHMLTDNLLVVADASQSLYDDLRSIDDVVRAWSPFDRCHTTLRNYRNPRYVAQVAACFLEASPLSREAFLREVSGHGTEYRPVWYEVDGPDGQTQQIADIIRSSRGAERIGVLFRTQRQLRGQSTRLKQAGVDHQVALTAWSYDFNDPRPVLTTFHSVKGLEFDWVILAGLDDDVWDQEAGDPKQRRLFFVGITRTKNRLYLISTKGRACSYLRENPADLLQKPTASSGATWAWAYEPSHDDEDDDVPF